MFFPVVQKFKDKRYITALMLGEASTGLLTSGLSTLQSIESTFTIEIFFLVLCFVVISCDDEFSIY